MYFQKGSTAFNDSTTHSIMPLSFSIKPLRSPRGRRWAYRVSLQGIGDIFVDKTITNQNLQQVDIANKITALETAFYADYESVGFYTDSGTVTPHYINTNAGNNYTGTLLTYLNWNNDEGCDFVTKKSFTFGFHVDFLDPWSGVYDWSDRIMKIGDAGSIIDWRVHPTAGPYYRVNSLYSAQRVVHRGYAIGINGYIDPPSPLYSRPYYLGHLTKIEKTTGKLFGNFGAYAMFRTSWEYVYVLTADTNLYPVFG